MIYLHITSVSDVVETGQDYDAHKVKMGDTLCYLKLLCLFRNRKQTKHPMIKEGDLAIGLNIKYKTLIKSRWRSLFSLLGMVRFFNY